MSATGASTTLQRSQVGRGRRRLQAWAEFTTACFHHPQELREEAASSGARVVDVVGLEGLAAWLPQLEERWSTPEAREGILFSAGAVESEPSRLGLSGHLISIARTGG